MKKKMTYKEFKEIVSETLMPTDYDDILNMFCVLLSYEEEFHIKNHSEAISKRNKSDRKRIYEALNDRGYYDNLK